MEEYVCVGLKLFIGSFNKCVLFTFSELSPFGQAMQRIMCVVYIIAILTNVLVFISVCTVINKKFYGLTVLFPKSEMN